MSNFKRCDACKKELTTIDLDLLGTINIYAWGRDFSTSSAHIVDLCLECWRGLKTLDYCSVHMAAPELLKAAKYALADLQQAHESHIWVDIDDHPKGGCEYCDTMKMLKAAIAKAEGSK